ncbi:MAG TPA: hypothetical protein VNI55_14690 [Gaiellaceae bacterium]|nr:hypothetical protein [Gaiellaceae bacterium]
MPASFHFARLRYDSSGTAWFEKELEGGWVVAYRLVSQAGRPVAAETRIYAGTIRAGLPGVADPTIDVPRGGITTSLLRLPVERHLKEAQEEWMRPEADHYLDAENDRYRDWDVPALWGFAKYLDTRPSPTGRKRRPDYEYAIFAALYVAAFAENRRAPFRVMVTRLEERAHPYAKLVESHYTADSLRNIVTKAREKGYLTSRGPGRAGGELTTLARRVLASLDVR